MKYHVRAVEDNCVCESIFETQSINEALEIVERQKSCNDRKFIILSCPEGAYTFMEPKKKLIR